MNLHENRQTIHRQLVSLAFQGSVGASHSHGIDVRMPWPPLNSWSVPWVRLENLSKWIDREAVGIIRHGALQCNSSRAMVSPTYVYFLPMKRYAPQLLAVNQDHGFGGKHNHSDTVGLLEFTAEETDIQPNFLSIGDRYEHAEKAMLAPELFQTPLDTAATQDAHFAAPRHGEPSPTFVKSKPDTEHEPQIHAEDDAGEEPLFCLALPTRGGSNVIQLPLRWLAPSVSAVPTTLFTAFLATPISL